MPALLALSIQDPAVTVVLGIAAAAAAFAVAMQVWGKSAIAQAQIEADRKRAEGKAEAENELSNARAEAKEELLRMLAQFEQETAETRKELKEIEKRLTKREDSFEQKLDTLSIKERKLDQIEERLSARDRAIEEKEKEIQALLAEQKSRLLAITGLSEEQAKNTLFSRLESDLEQEIAEKIRESLELAKEEAREKSRDVILTAIQRYAAEHTAEGTVSTVSIPSDDMKGRVIGREGRNIRAFEKATGVDIIVDDTPGVVEVSAFNPVRREKARITLERLIQDGRIHPGRIEEIFNEVSKEVDKTILEEGKAAVLEANIGGLHRKLIELLGKLKYRTSYGQNVLRHSLEVAYLCQVIADELGLDGRLARRCGLLHDIGKAADHELEGGHPKIGGDFCRKFGEHSEVVNAVEGHHGDVESTSPYTPIVMAADAISAARPGGRRESLERYIQRLEQFEAIAHAHEGVREAYAIQAGREIRVIVDAGKMDDARTARLARDIANQVEAECTYPGEIRVTVVREMRSVEYAK